MLLLRGHCWMILRCTFPRLDEISLTEDRSRFGWLYGICYIPAFAISDISDTPPVWPRQRFPLRAGRSFFTTVDPELPLPLTLSVTVVNLAGVNVNH